MNDEPETPIMTRTTDLQTETGAVRFCPNAERRSRERIILESVLEIAIHGRSVATGYHAELHAIAKQAALRLGGVAA